MFMLCWFITTFLFRTQPHCCRIQCVPFIFHANGVCNVSNVTIYAEKCVEFLFQCCYYHVGTKCRYYFRRLNLNSTDNETEMLNIMSSSLFTLMKLKRILNSYFFHFLFLPSTLSLSAHVLHSRFMIQLRLDGDFSEEKKNKYPQSRLICRTNAQ